MNPYKLREVFKQLTSQNSILKKYLKLGTKEIKQPDLPAFVEQKNMFNRFMRDNPRPDQIDRKDMAGGGMLVQPSADGSRPGYAGKERNVNVIAKEIEKANQGFKFFTGDEFAKKVGFNSGSHLLKYIKDNNLPKLESFNKKVEKAWISLFENGDNKASTVFKPLIKIREMVGGGQKDYGSGKTKRVRTDSISNALKKSDLLVWDDIKPLINRLSNQNFINSLNRKGGDYTITDVEYSTYNKSGMLRAPKTDAEHLIDYVIRHVNQSDKPLYAIYDSKTNKRITDLNNVESYHDIYFKSESPFQDNTKYDMDYLKTKARKDPLFKEYFDLQDQLFEMKNRKFWPDGSRIIDAKTGKGTTFGKWSGSLYKEGYGYTKSFERFPYDTDHKFGVGKHPFKDLAILPQRINIALGSVKQKNRGDLSKKIGADYFRNLSVDDLMMQEKDFGKKILIFDKDGNHIGKKLETPYQNAKRMVKYYNDLDLFNAGRGPKPEFPLSDFQKPAQAIPIKQRLETFKQGKFNRVPPTSVDGPSLGSLDIGSMFKRLSPGAKKVVSFGTGTVLPELLFYELEKINRESKGQTEQEAAAGALGEATFGLYDNNIYMDNLKKTAEKMNIDSGTFDSAYNLNLLNKEYQNMQAYTQRQIENAQLMGDKKLENTAIRNFEKYVNDITPEYNRLSNDISERLMGGSPLTMFQGREKITDKQFAQPFMDMQKAAVQKLKDEKIRAFDVQKRQSDTAAGSVGNTLLSNLFNVQSVPKASKYLLDLAASAVNPKMDTPKYSDYLSDAEKENQMLRSLDLSDLNLVNLARGYTMENLREADIDSPILARDIENLKYERPGVFFAGGGIAKIAGVDSGPPPESGPNPQGLSYLMKRGKNI